MTDQRRLQLGIAAVGVGSLLLVFGVIAAHFTGLSATDSVGREIYPHVPRCLPWENDPTACWMLPTTGQLIALAGSQLLLGGLVFGWIVGRPLTWARATVAALIATIELIILFGVIPNEWLSLTQGPLEWTGQKDAFTLPRWLTLNNEVSVSYKVIKDVVSGGYSALMLGAIAVTAYRVQERAKRPPAPAPERVSSYGRPVVRGGE